MQRQNPPAVEILSLRNAWSILRIGFFGLFMLFPFLAWVLQGQKLHLIVWGSAFLLYLATCFIPKLRFLRNSLEIVGLFALLNLLSTRLGLAAYFPLDRLVILFFMYLFLFVVRKKKRADLYLAKGKAAGLTGISVIFAVVSVAALAWWFLGQKSNPFASQVPRLSIIGLVAAGIGFALVNAVYEEGIFRSILFSHFRAGTGLWPAVFLQAIWFSFLHYQAGFPSGISGIVLTFVFGLMTVYLLLRSGGILMPVLLHFIADFSIFLLVVFRMKSIS